LKWIINKNNNNDNNYDNFMITNNNKNDKNFENNIKENEYLLKNINLNVNLNSRIAIVGRNGQGFEFIL
jgi:ABC-type polysaccharide/polyol phosphate transport system ATPase subunit